MIATLDSQFNTLQVPFTSPAVLLDPERKNLRVEHFEQMLSKLIVGQERAVRSMSDLYQVFVAGMNQSDRPLGTLLFLVGKMLKGKLRVNSYRENI